MYAIFQVNYTIYGVGETLESAYQDAQEWAEELPAIEELPQYVPGGRGSHDGDLVWARCSAELADKVKADGGDLRFEFQGSELVLA